MLHRKPMILNCGTLLRRKSDETNYKPSVGLLYRDETIKRHYLDCSQDKFAEIAVTKSGSDEFRKLVNDLEELDENHPDFEEAINRYFRANKVSRQIREIILNAMEKRK